MAQIIRSTLYVLVFSLLSVHSLPGEEKRLTMIVMDPLAEPLSCPCVEGYAQRKYEALAEHLKISLGREVQLVFASALSTALRQTASPADLIIGKDSLVRADADAAKIQVTAIARLTDKTGSTTQRGLIVVNRADPAQATKDLNGYKIIFGPSDAAEKHSAALQLFRTAGVSIPQTLEIDEACSDGACKVIDLGPKSRTAAVISSYAQPLLEGCGTIKKGDLRVVGETMDVPFIAAFASSSLSPTEQQAVTAALLSVNHDPVLLDALESLAGFLACEDAVAAKKK